MKAIISNQYGSPDTLECKSIEKPIPKDNQLLIKIHATSLNFGNLVLLKGEPFLTRFAFGLFKPKYKIPGSDIAGVVEAVGPSVSQKFQKGDEVYGDLSSCDWGGFAEYVAVPEHAITHKPSNLTFEEAAAVPMAAVTALQAIRDKGNVQAGQQVLIYGASGGVGTFAVQIAKAFGAEVTAVCSTNKVEIVKSIGADHVIDYKKEDFAQRTERYDVIIGANGYQPISVFTRALKDKAGFVLVGGAGKQMFYVMVLGPWVSLIKKKKMEFLLQRPNQKDLVFMKELIEAGKVTPVLDRTFTSLHEVPEALNYFQEGHAKGKVVISVAEK